MAASAGNMIRATILSLLLFTISRSSVVQGQGLCSNPCFEDAFSKIPCNPATCKPCRYTVGGKTYCVAARAPGLCPRDGQFFCTPGGQVHPNPVPTPGTPLPSTPGTPVETPPPTAAPVPTTIAAIQPTTPAGSAPPEPTTIPNIVPTSEAGDIPDSQPSVAPTPTPTSEQSTTGATQTDPQHSPDMTANPELSKAESKESTDSPTYMTALIIGGGVLGALFLIGGMGFSVYRRYYGQKEPRDASNADLSTIALPLYAVPATSPFHMKKQQMAGFYLEPIDSRTYNRTTRTSATSSVGASVGPAARFVAAQDANVIAFKPSEPSFGPRSTAGSIGVSTYRSSYDGKEVEL